MPLSWRQLWERIFKARIKFVSTPGQNVYTTLVKNSANIKDKGKLAVHLQRPSTCTAVGQGPSFNYALGSIGGDEDSRMEVMFDRISPSSFGVTSFVFSSHECFG